MDNQNYIHSKFKFIEAQIKQGLTLTAICQDLGVDPADFERWRKKGRLIELEREADTLREELKSSTAQSLDMTNGSSITANSKRKRKAAVKSEHILSDEERKFCDAIVVLVCEIAMKEIEKPDSNMNIIQTDACGE